MKQKIKVAIQGKLGSFHNIVVNRYFEDDTSLVLCDSFDQTVKELLEENRLKVVDRATITELMTFVTKGNSFEADRGYHDDMVMNLVLFGWFITTEFFYHLTDKQVKDLLYAEQQKMIEDDVLPAGVFGESKPEESRAARAKDRTVPRDGPYAQNAADGWASEFLRPWLRCG